MLRTSPWAFPLVFFGWLMLGPLSCTVVRRVPHDPSPTAPATTADGADRPDEPIELEPAAPLGAGPLGATLEEDGALTFRLFAEHATRVELWLYEEALGAPPVKRAPLSPVSLGAKPGSVTSGQWVIRVSAEELVRLGLEGPIYYGYRLWGPNFPYQPSWTPGTTDGFLADVDSEGHRYNPNKVLTDPYAREISHDPVFSGHEDGNVFKSGEKYRAIDSGPVAPKGLVLRPSPSSQARPAKPNRPFKDEVIYEVHLRGLTRGDASLSEDERGTFEGAAKKAAYLRELGVTAVEFLPIQETQNDQNDFAEGTDGDNYWGYSTLAFFAPDRRYARDKLPGGPTRELKAMIDRFHAEGIKVYADVVYNHFAEGGVGSDPNTATLLSFRGLDNVSYYELAKDKRRYHDNTGVSANTNATHEAFRDLVVDSVRYLADEIGFDGFRFDLAPVLGNSCKTECFKFDATDTTNALHRLSAELPLRPASGGPGVDLIAEPWAIGAGTYQLGQHPVGWGEWNDKFRDTVRRDQNRLGQDGIPPRELLHRVMGSPDVFKKKGHKPWHSVNYVASHDGFTLADLYRYDKKKNDQAWPFGPSNGGTNDNYSWDHEGNLAAQEQAARTGLAFVLLSAGVPMFTGGDERLRSLSGNNNPYNLDSEKNWLAWDRDPKAEGFAEFTRRLLAFRRDHPALRPSEFWSGKRARPGGPKDVTWLDDDGVEAELAYLDDPAHHFLAYRLDGRAAGDSATSILVAYNGWTAMVNFKLPAALEQRTVFYWAGSTAAEFEGRGFVLAPDGAERVTTPEVRIAPRSVAIFVER